MCQRTFDKVFCYSQFFVPRLENQEANDLAQISSWYKISKEKLTQLIEIKEKKILQEPLSEHLSMPKLVGANAIP
jgi:hypothetical protein